MVLRRQLPLWLLRRGYYMAITMCVKTQQNTDHALTAALPATPHNLFQHHLGYQQQQPSPPLSEHESTKQDDDAPPMTIIAAATADFNDNPDKLCRHILDTFFSCYAVRYTILHQRTFYRLFVTPIASSSSSLLDSPVICAVCAVALTIRCRHMLPSIPYQHQVQVADILYRRARDIMDFDEPTLATFIVLSFLAMYKQLIFCVEEATFYLDMAFRTRCLLVDDDDDDDDNDDVDDDTRGERELIKRLHWALWETQTSVEYYKNQRGVPQSTTAKSSSASSLYCNARSENPISTLMKEKKHRYRRRPLPDEPPIIHRTLRNAYYKSEMMAAQGSFLRQVRFGNKDTIDVNYLAETEYRFNKYYQGIPADCRMPPGILEEGLSDSDFRKRLDTLRGDDRGGGIGRVDEDDDGNLTAALALTLQYLQGVISLYEPFLPDLKDRQRAQGAGLLKDDGDTPSFTGSSTTKTGSKFIKEEETSARTTGESEVTMHQLRAQQKCTHAATSIVRLLDYQRSLPHHCTVNVHILLTAWDIHMRNACLGMTIPPDDDDDGHDNSSLYFHCLTTASIHQARRSLLQCLSILREGYLFNFAEHAVWEYYEHVEQQLLFSLPRQHPSTAPTAAYWIPFGS
ncbi:unnamed protein product [Absidia cylindrospora]